MAGLGATITIDFLYSLLMLACLHVLFKCALTDPGIIPAIHSEPFNENANFCKFVLFSFSCKLRVK